MASPDSLPLAETPEIPFFKRKGMKYIKLLLTFAIPLLFLIPETTSLYTQEIKTFFVITTFVVIIVAFDYFNLLIPALILPMLYLIFNVAPAETVFKAWTIDIIWVIVGAQIFAGALGECGLLQRIAYYGISKTSSTFTGFMYAFCLSISFITVITFGQAWIILIVFVWALLKTLNYKHNKQAAIIVIITEIGMATVTLFIMYPPMQLLVNQGAQVVEPDFLITWVTQLAYGWPIAIYIVIYLWLVSKIYKTDDMEFSATGREYFTNELKKLGPLSTKEKYAIFVTTLLFLYVGFSPWHGYNLMYGFVLIPILMYIPGLPVTTDANAAFKEINFGAYAIVATFCSMGFVGHHVGLGAFLSSFVEPVMTGHGNSFASFFTMILGTIANLFMSPMGFIAALTTPLATMVHDLGHPLLGSMLSLYYSYDLIIFPYEDMAVLILFSGGYALIKDYIPLAILKVVLFYIFWAVVLLPYWHLLGIM